MNKIFNWTIGSVFRTIGRVIGYLIIGGLLALFMSKNGLKITDLLGIDSIHASTISYDYSKYYVRTTDYPYSNSDNTWSSALNLGEFYNTTDIGYVNSIRTRFGVNAKFSANTKYRVKINVKFNNDSDKSIYLDANSVICQGSATSTWSSDENLIDSCRFVARTYYNENKNASYLFDIIPNTNIYGIQIAFYIKGSQYPYWSGDRIQAIRVLASSNITTDSSTSDTINNSTTEIIYNNNKNTEDIINNQNELLGSKCPNLFNKNDITTGLTFNNSGGTSVLANSFVGNSYVGVTGGSSITISIGTQTNFTSETDYRLMINEYNSSKTWIKRNLIQVRQATITLDSNTKYIKIGASTITKDELMVNYGSLKSYCEYGSYQSKLDDTNNAINGLNDSINDDNTSGATSSAGGFFSSFNTDTHGLTGIITAPLTAINRLTSTNCSPLVLPLPFVNQNLTLPCMRPIYTSNFGSFMDLYDVIVIGIISYWILVRIFALVKDFKNPEHDEIEVMDL